METTGKFYVNGVENETKVDTFGFLVYSVLAPKNVGLVDWYENIKKPGFEVMGPMPLGEAVRNCLGKRKYPNIRMEKSEQGLPVLIWLETTKDEASGEYAVTYSATKSNLVRVKESNLSQEQKDQIERFENEVNDLVGTMPESRILANSKEVLLQKFQAIRMRRDGGVYFVPEKHKDELIRFVECSSKIGVNIPLVYMARVGSNLASVSQGVKDDFIARLNQLKRSMEVIKGERGYATNLAESLELIQQAQYFEIVLGEKLDILKLLIGLHRDNILSIMDMDRQIEKRPHDNSLREKREILVEQTKQYIEF